MSDTERSVAAADARFAELNGDESVIPKGLYCYTVTGRTPATADDPGRLQTKTCPYWAMDDAGHGYCAQMKVGDAEPVGTMLLFDKVKECGINDEDVDDPDV